MQGSSRTAVLEGRASFETALTSGDPAVVADELFAVTGLLDDNAPLRRSVADPSREGKDKADLITRLLDGKLSSETVGIAFRPEKLSLFDAAGRALRTALHDAAALTGGHRHG